MQQARLLFLTSLRRLHHATASVTLVVALVANLTMAPRAHAEFENLIGKVFEGALPVEGWDNMGGGLLAGSVWFTQYRRSDGAFLVLSLLALPPRPNSQQTPFKVADVLYVPPLEPGYDLSTLCRPIQGSQSQKFIAVVRLEDSEIMRDVRQVWTVDVSSGRIVPVMPVNVECFNEGWGE
jgi:hypothetical protein